MEITQLETLGQTPTEEQDSFPLGALIGIENTGNGLGVVHHNELTQEEVAAILYGVAMQLINSNRAKETLQ